MRLLLATLVVLSISFGIDAGSMSSESMPSSAAESAETPITNSDEYLHIDMNKLGDAFMNFGFELGPIANNSAYDVYNKISEFATTMSGVQPILSLSSLYGEYIPTYAVSKECVDRKIAKLPGMMNPSSSQVVSVLLTDPQWSTIGLALNMMSSYNLLNVQGIIDKINSLQTLVYNPDFTFVGGVISVPDSDAQNFYNSFATSISATQGLVQSYQSIVALNKTVVMLQQEDKSAEKLVHTIFHFYEELIKINGNIIDQLQSTVASFSPVSSSTDTYTIPIKSQVENVLSDANNYAMQFEHIGNVLNAMANKIMG